MCISHLGKCVIRVSIIGIVPVLLPGLPPGRTNCEPVHSAKSGAVADYSARVRDRTTILALLRRDIAHLHRPWSAICDFSATCGSSLALQVGVEPFPAGGRDGN